MVKWTPEQKRAIEERDANILVAAAAGSGKTAVLVERIIQRILDEEEQLNIDEMLIATFTNAAAEEMRQRIGLALDKALQENPASYHLKKQLSLLQRASISTLHSFCMQVVREYSYLLDLDPAFRIADDMEIDLLKHEVLDELFEEWYGQEGEAVERFFAVVDMFSSDRSDAEVEALIVNLHTFAKQHPWPKRWLERVAEMYNVDDAFNETDVSWLKLLKQEINVQLHTFKKRIEKAMQIAREPDGPYHYLDALEADRQLIDEALKRIDSWDDLQSFVANTKFKNLSAKRVECDEAKKETIKKIRDAFRKEWNSLKKRFFGRSLAQHRSDMEKLYPVVQHLIHLVLQFEERFQAIKRERAIVDFNDLEHFALAILTEPDSDEDEIVPSRIAQYYQNKFKEILVDEYQDINLVQETIIRAISRKSGNVFMVGDVKQSIYRFRHAEPSLFISKYEAFAKDERAGKRIDLAKNFRSREHILTGANFIFKQIFDSKLGDIAYDDAAALVYGNKGYDEFPIERDEVELVIINDEKGREAKDDFAEHITKEQLEARLYAKKIKEWLGHDGNEPLKVLDKKTNTLRDVQYRDIVILLRSMSSAPTIVDELKQQGIPVYAELKTGYFQAIEIQVMINMLKIIDNPYQDIPLASVLRSPIVGLNEEQLAQIRLAKRNAPFYEAVKKASRENDDLKPMLEPFLKQLETYRKMARERSLSELIWTIFQTTGYYDYVGGIPGGRQRQANLRALYDRARSYEETSFRGLFRFLRFIERMEKRKKDLGEARALSEQEDVVRITTIHKSKGLEFPVVILGELNKEFNLQDLKGKYILNKEHGFATKFIDPIKRVTYSTLYYLAVREEEKRHLLSEEMRILYVALTRAKEKLVMVGRVNDIEKEKEKWREAFTHDELVLPLQLRKNAKTYLDWIGPALIRHPDASTLRENDEPNAEVPAEIASDDSKWRIEIIDRDALLETAPEEELDEETLRRAIQNWEPLPAEKAMAYDELVAKRLQFTYPFEQAMLNRAKQSVTEIKRRFETSDAYSERRVIRTFKKIATERPKFIKQTKELTRAEIGTAMHTVMQHIPFDRSWDEDGLADFVQQLVMEEKLTDEEAEAIDIEAILQFFATDLASLMKRHKIEREIPFSYTLDAEEVYDDWQGDEKEKVLIQGVIDCIVFTAEGLVLVDYKTDEIRKDELTEKTIERLKNRYRIQMKLYKRALEDILAQPVMKTYLYFFSKKLTVEL